jgi:hypothetical protein
VLKQFVFKISSFSLALLVMLSTVSFTVEKHFCGNVLVDVAVFSEAKDCSGNVSSDTEKTTMKKKSCCKDEVNVMEGQDELKVRSFDDIQFEQQLFLASYVYSYVNLFEGLPQLVVPHKDYSPPNLVKDIQVVDQVFLI